MPDFSFLDEDRTSTIIFSNCPKHYFYKTDNGWVKGVKGGGGRGKGQVVDISDYNIHNLPAVVSIPYTSTLKTFSASNSVG